MISSLLIMNAKGDVVISRQYRGDVSVTAAEAFRLKIVAAKETGELLLYLLQLQLQLQLILTPTPHLSGTTPPAANVENSSFLYTRHLNLYFVAVTRSNVNPALVFEYLKQKVLILKAYLGDKFDESNIRNNMTLLYELLDETMDFGYPQNCAIDVLRLYINLGSVKQQEIVEPSQLTSQITGAIDWRREGIRHKKNEVYIDVLESVNLLLSSTGNILRNEVTGQVMMNTKLTGMPECKFGLNDKLVIDKEKKR